MSEYNICINCVKVEVEYSSDRQKVEVGLEGVELDDLITEVGSTHVLNHFCHDDIAQYVIDNDIEIIKD